MSRLKFVKISSSEQVAVDVEKLISTRLIEGKNILWLLSGGSAIEIAISASKMLADKDLSRLTISLVDERYGKPGHKDSNWQNLLQHGFRTGSAKLHPVLNGFGPEQTTDEFNQFLEKQLIESDYKLALLGMGTDGHTAGILPGSQVITSSDYADYYKTADYERITMTPKGLALMDEAIVYCRGSEKAEAIANLDHDLPIIVQPAQIIKQIPKVSVYNDLKGEVV